jgi:hypothetical protein
MSKPWSSRIADGAGRLRHNFYLTLKKYQSAAEYRSPAPAATNVLKQQSGHDAR